MKKIYLLAIIFTQLLFFSSCKKVADNIIGPKITFNKSDYNKIISDSNWKEVTDTVHVLPVISTDLKYVNYNVTENGGAIINNEIQLFVLYSSSKPKRVQFWPEVDFSKRTVLGLGNSWSPENFEIHIYRNSSIKEYIYMIYYKHAQIEYVNCNSTNMVSIPKIPSGYKVEFAEFKNY